MKTEFNPLRGLYKLLGRSEDLVMELGANATIKITVGQTVVVLPARVVHAIQSQPAIDYLRDPAIATFLYAANERETRVWAARELVSSELMDLRREFKRQLMEFGLSEAEAFILARTKYPVGTKA